MYHKVLQIFYYTVALYYSAFIWTLLPGGFLFKMSEYFDYINHDEPVVISRSLLCKKLDVVVLSIENKLKLESRSYP